MSKLIIAFTLFFLSFIASAAAQGNIQSCSKVCRRLRGQCSVSLLELSRTPCLDKRTNSARTCDCNVDIQKLQALKSTDVVRDCVIPGNLINFNSAVDIKPKFINVHVAGITNIGGSLRQSGNILRSTICDWKCVGRNRFQNCVLASSVTRSNIRLLSAEDEATLSLSGPKFNKNKVEFIRSDKDISIGNKDGFKSNTVKTLATSRFGRLSTVAGTSITENHFDQLAVGPITSFANVDGNTAGSASTEGPCVVSEVKSPIAVEGGLSLPAGDRNCARLFEKA